MSRRAPLGKPAPRSPIHVERPRMFQEVSGAARSVRLMADYLERHPEGVRPRVMRTGHRP
ncbi:hypothetical protein CKO27_11380 [Thiocystis violacea]|nr:hypothetical protein [Thiocystis violacea]